MGNQVPNTVGERLRAVRKALHLTQSEFCDGKEGLTRANIASIEVGKSTPSNLVLLKICEYYHTSMDYLLQGTGPMFPDRTESDQIIDFANSVIREDSDPAMRKLVLALADLEPAEWQVLAKIAKKMADSAE